MSLWDHPVCDDCWELTIRPIEQRDPVRVRGDLGIGWGDLEICCWCMRHTRSGIYYRLDPVQLPSHLLAGIKH